MIEGSRFFVTFMDDVSRKTWIYFLKSKNQVYVKFKQFHALVTNESGLTMKKLHSNNGGEYMDLWLQKFLDEQGIVHQPVAPYTPEHNRVAERKN